MFAYQQPELQYGNSEMASQYWSLPNHYYQEQNTQPYQVPLHTFYTSSDTSSPIHEDAQASLQSDYDSNYSSIPIQYEHNTLTPEPVTYPVFELPKPNPFNNVMTKKHRAQISLVPTSCGSFKAIVKRKRKRTVFTTEQIQALEDIFKTKQYISREDRQVIVKNLNLNDKAVKIWFQNRRLKDKRVPEQLSTPESVEERKSPEATRLDNVEYQISERTNEFGYVTLDDDVMGDLVTVINDFLTNDVEVTSGDTVKADANSFYEPISPASISDGPEEPASWNPAEPNESLQRLFDLQTLLSS